MRFHIALAAIAFSFVCAPALYAQNAAPTAPAPATPPASTTATPAASASAAAGKPIVCEATASQGDVISMRQCVSQAEATRRRVREQEAVRQFQMQSLTMEPK